MSQKKYREAKKQAMAATANLLNPVSSPQANIQEDHDHEDDFPQEVPPPLPGPSNDNSDKSKVPEKSSSAQKQIYRLIIALKK